MKKKAVSGATVLLFMLALLAASILGLDASLRHGSPTLSVAIEDAALENDRFTMTADQSWNSGTAFRRYSYEIEENALYVTLFSGLVYGNFRESKLRIDIRDDGLDAVRQVYLRNGSSAKLIYSK